MKYDNYMIERNLLYAQVFDLLFPLRVHNRDYEMHRILILTAHSKHYSTGDMTNIDHSNQIKGIKNDYSVLINNIIECIIIKI